MQQESIMQAHALPSDARLMQRAVLLEVQLGREGLPAKQLYQVASKQHVTSKPTQPIPHYKSSSGLCRFPKHPSAPA